MVLTEVETGLRLAGSTPSIQYTMPRSARVSYKDKRMCYARDAKKNSWFDSRIITIHRGSKYVTRLTIAFPGLAAIGAHCSIEHFGLD